MSHLGTLCIFARAPERELVKTRLAAQIGADAALAAYQRLVDLALSRYAHVPDLHSELWLSGDPAHPEVRGWVKDWKLPLFGSVAPILESAWPTPWPTPLTEAAPV